MEGEVLGLDIGGVQTTAVPGVFEAVRRLVDDHVAVLVALETVPHRSLFPGGGTSVPDEIPAWVGHVTG